MSDIECAFSGVALKPPDLKMSKANKPYCQFSLAVGEGEGRKFIRVAAFGETAEKVAAQLKVGGRAYVEGNLEVGIWAPEGRPPQANMNCAARRVEILGQIGKNRPRYEREPSGDAKGQMARSADYGGDGRPFDDRLDI